MLERVWGLELGVMTGIFSDTIIAEHILRYSHCASIRYS